MPCLFASAAMLLISFNLSLDGRYLYPLILSPLLKYSVLSCSAGLGRVALNLCQLSGLTLYAELVMCLTPVEARVSMRLSGLSFTNGIIGSMRTDVGMPFSISVSTVFIRFDEDGAFGSMSSEMLSLSVVIVRVTIDGIFFKKSMSLTTMSDFVII